MAATQPNGLDNDLILGAQSEKFMSQPYKYSLGESDLNADNYNARVERSVHQNT